MPMPKLPLVWVARLAKLRAKLPLIAGALAVVLLVLGSVYAVGRVQGRAAGTQACEASHAKALAKAQAQTQRQIDALTSKGDALDRALTNERARFARENTALQRRIEHVSTQYRAAPGAAPQPAPVCVFTRGWLRDYNAAYGVPAATAAAAAGLDAAASAAAGADAELLDAGLSRSDLLAHAGDSGERCRGLEKQVNALIDYVQFDPAQAGAR
ncbi:MAG: hypothetical protein U0973_11550 [Xanthomonadaceae bacterium]|nr:hypothetical protein [Xanthomonadaceae bacterium]